MLNPDAMPTACSHQRRDEDRCLDCGACMHPLVLNRVCAACGAVDPVVSVKPASGVVPMDRLRKR